jgi:hypothetical protein
MHYHVAEFITEVFFLYHGIGESKAQRDATVIESLGDESHIILVALAVFHTASVPERRRENTVNGSYLHALTEKLRAFFKHGDEHEKEPDITWNMDDDNQSSSTDGGSQDGDNQDTESRQENPSEIGPDTTEPDRTVGFWSKIKNFIMG